MSSSTLPGSIAVFITAIVTMFAPREPQRFDVQTRISCHADDKKRMQNTDRERIAISFFGKANAVTSAPFASICLTLRPLLVFIACALPVTALSATGATAQAATQAVNTKAISATANPAPAQTLTGSIASQDGFNTKKPRAVSINLCADQLLLTLADDAQILSLTNLSHDPAGSYHYLKARSFATNTGVIEEVLPLQPDLVIAGQFTNRYTLQLLAAVGLRVELLPIASSVEVMLDNIAKVAGWLGQHARGEHLVAALKRRLATLPPPPPAPPAAAIYDPNGYTVGDSSLRGQALKIAGWHNVASDRGISSYGQLPLETLLKLAPEALIESPYSAGTWSRAQAINSHPALTSRGLNTHVISVPSSHTICGGPWTLDVIEQLLHARKINNHDAADSTR